MVTTILLLEMVACSLPPAPTPTPISIIPTATVPLPTSTPTPSAETLSFTTGALLFREEFATNSWGWTEREDGTRQVMEGRYRIDETKSPYEWITQSNPRLLLDNPLAPRPHQPYELSLEVTFPPDLTLYSLGIESNMQSLPIAGRDEVVAHTFTVRSNNTWIYSGGAGDATAALYRTGTIPPELELRDGKPHTLTLQFFPTPDALHLIFMIDGVVVAALDDLRPPTPDLAPFFQEVNGTIGITFGITTDLIRTIIGEAPLRLTADFDNVEIRQLIIDNG